jgi:mono/diheme cytochrome c family protein
MKKKLYSCLMIASAGLLLTGLLSAFRPFQEKKPWPVPDAAKNKKNPVASSAESIAAGKALWSTHCKSCHGVKGLGDGSKAAQLKTEPGDFSRADVQSQTDGALFYKSAEGRDDMPAFKKKIPDADDIWSIVNYIRTLKK